MPTEKSIARNLSISFNPELFKEASFHEGIKDAGAGALLILHPDYLIKLCEIIFNKLQTKADQNGQVIMTYVELFVLLAEVVMPNLESTSAIGTINGSVVPEQLRAYPLPVMILHALIGDKDTIVNTTSGIRTGACQAIIKSAVLEDSKTCIKNSAAPLQQRAELYEFVDKGVKFKRPSLSFSAG